MLTHLSIMLVIILIVAIACGYHCWLEGLFGPDQEEDQNGRSKR